MCGLTWTLIGILLLSVVESNGYHLRGRILGSTTASAGQFPYMVSLNNRQNQFPICGGAIVNDFYTITSAYCTKPYANYPELVAAHLGAWDKNAARPSAIAEIKLHPNYDAATKTNDISLIRMVNKITFTNNVQPIALPKYDFPDESGQKLMVSGFGLWFVSICALESFLNYHFSRKLITIFLLRLKEPKRVPDSAVRARTLRFDETTSITREMCISGYAGVMKKHSLFALANVIGPNVICTSNPREKGLCLGDRGNPLVANRTLVGIASWCIDCNSNYPNVYTKVFSYRKWIQTESSF